MTDINTVFTRRLMKAAHADVRAAFPQIQNVWTAASVTYTGNDYSVQIDVPGLASFHHECRAYDCYEARYKAWMALLRKHGPTREAEAA